MRLVLHTIAAIAGVFEANGDPGEHLPPKTRGVLGEMNTELLGRLKATLRQVLQRL